MGAVAREQVADESIDQRNRRKISWEPHPTLQDLLRDHYKDAWEKVRTCGLGVHLVERDKLREDRHRVRPKRTCGVRPWCPQCNARKHYKRANKARERIELCTPAGQDVRLVHIVQTFPHFADGTGYGHVIYQNPDLAFEIMDQQLRWAFGDNIGWVGSYQAFGEEGPRQIHPHLDLTLSGWTSNGEKVPMIHLAHGGADEWQEHLRTTAEKVLGITVGPETARWRLASWANGWPEYWRALKYQTREVLDPRKLTYDRQERIVRWWSYDRDDQTERATIYTLPDWKGSVAGYQHRYQQWQKGSTQLTRYYGHLADRNWRNTWRTVGGQAAKHRDGCICNQCGDWERIYIPEATLAMIRMDSLDPSAVGVPA